MPKILHVIDHMGLGGAQRIVADLAGSGFGDFVFALRSKSSDEIALPAKVQFSIGGSSVISILLSVFKLDRIIRSQGIQIVHCHLPASFFVGLLLSFKHKDVKFIFHEHGWVLFGSAVYHTLLQLVSTQGLILACSEYIGRNIQNVSPKANLQVLPNFIDIKIFTRMAEKRKRFRERLGYKEKDLLIGFAGRLVREKGWYELVKAIPQIENNKDVYLLIAGRGPDMEKIDDILKDEKLQNVHLLGYESDMVSFYNGLDIFVLPSLIEPFGLVQLEAQACGVPVIASDIDGVRETVDRDCAVLVPAGDSALLADELQRLILSPPVRDSLSRNGFENAQQFSKELYLKKLEQVYRNL